MSSITKDSLYSASTKGDHQSKRNSDYLNKEKINSSNIRQDTLTPLESARKSKQKKKMFNYSCERTNTPATEALFFTNQRNNALKQDKKNYAKKCETIINRIEAIKKKDEILAKQIIKINKQKVMSAQIQVDKLNRQKEIAEIQIEIDQEKLFRKKRAQEDHIIEITNVQSVIQEKTDNNKKLYEERIKEKEKAAIEIIDFKKAIEVNKKEYADKVRSTCVDPISIKEAVRMKEEEKRTKMIEATIEQEEKHTKALKEKLLALEKKEEQVFEHMTKTRQQNEYLLSEYYSRSENKNHDINKKKQVKKNKSVDVEDQYEESMKNAKKIQDEYNEKLKVLNTLIKAEKKFISSNKKGGD